jgi:Golgi SNAP receptor complex protein 1
MMDFNGQKKMWESFRAEARRKDTDLEAKLTRLEALAYKCDGASYADFARHHEAAQQEVNELATVVNSMGDVMNSSVTRGGAQTEVAAMKRATQRFEDVVQEKQTTLKKLSMEAKKRKERAELLHNVHTEIAIHDETSEMRHLAGEQESLRHAQRHTRQLLDQAEANRQRLRQQREFFNRIGDNVLAVADQVPVIKDLLKRIDSKRRREAVILAIVIAICLILVLVFW